MADQDTTWTWNFTGPTTSSKAQSRPNLPKDVAWDLIGFDGNITNGLQSHTGFRHLGTIAGAGSADGLAFLTWQTSPNDYINGVMLFTYSSGAAVLYSYSSGSFTQVASVSCSVVGSSISAMSAKAIGNRIYVGARGGRSKVIVKTFAGSDTDNTNTYVSWDAGSALSTTKNKPTIKIYTDTSPNVFSGVCAGANPGICTGGASGYPICSCLPYMSDFQSGSDDLGLYVPCNGEQDIYYKPPGGSNNQAYPSRYTAAGMYPPGTYSFAIQYVSTVTGRKSPLSDIATITINNSAIQRKVVPFSNRPIYFRVKRPDLVSNGLGYDKALIYRSVRLSAAGGVNYGNNTLHLEKVVDFTAPGAGYSAVAPGGVWPPVQYFTPTCSTSGSGGYPYMNGYLDLNEKTSGARIMSTDSELVYQDVYTDKGENDQFIPPGGELEFLGSTLFVSRISGTSSDTSTDEYSNSEGDTTPGLPRGVGELRWSSTTDPVPDHFSPFNRWVPSSLGSEIMAMRRVNNFIMGFSGDRMYRIGRVPSTSYIQVEELHSGYGVAGSKALEAVGSMVYFVSGGGLKAVSVDGQLDDVTSLDTLINETWLDNKDKIQMSFDARGQCLTILKPWISSSDPGHAACLWFGTNRVTELVDLPFKFVGSWNVGSSTNAGTTVATRRSVFVKPDGRIYLADHERSNNSTKNLMGGTGRWVSITGPSGTITPTADESYCYVYNGVTGQKTALGASGTPVTVTVGGASDVPISVAPVFIKWTGNNVGFQLQPDQPEFKDFFRLKQINGARAYIEVSGTIALPGGLPVGNDAANTWSAELISGTETSSLTSAYPTDRSGNRVNALLVPKAQAPTAPFGRHGVAEASLSPSFVCRAVGARIKLLAFSLYGRILDTDRRYT